MARITYIPPQNIGAFMIIGGAVTSGLNNRVLFINPAGILAQSTNFQFDTANQVLNLIGINNTNVLNLDGTVGATDVLGLGFNASRGQIVYEGASLGGMIFAATNRPIRVSPIGVVGDGLLLATTTKASLWQGTGALNTSPQRRFSIKAGAAVKQMPVGGRLNEASSNAGNVVATGETDLYSYNTEANLLATNGDAIEFEYNLTIIADAVTTKRVKVYFAGTVIYDSGAALVFAVNDVLYIKGWIIRASATIVRGSVMAQNNTAVGITYTQYTEINPVTLSGANILKLTGESAGVGANNGDVTARSGIVDFNEAGF